jgi:6-phosphogluconolactonase
MSEGPQIQIYPDLNTLAAQATEQIEKLAAAAIAAKGNFSLVLSGGSTPKTLYQLLADKFRTRIDWSKVEIYFGDERCVPSDDPQSNFRMANEAMLSKLPIPEKNIHRMRGEIEPQAAAIEYGQLLKEKFANGGADVVLLGMGPDGHTGSLFPGTEVFSEVKHRCVAVFVQKLNMWRITMTAPFINRAQNVMVMVVGADKADRLREVLKGPRDPQRLPIQLIAPASGNMIWLLDSAAAAEM